jgi:hypothetical protein
MCKRIKEAVVARLTGEGLSRFGVDVLPDLSPAIQLSDHEVYAVTVRDKKAPTSRQVWSNHCRIKHAFHTPSTASWYGRTMADGFIKDHRDVIEGTNGAIMQEHTVYTADN